MSTKPKDAAAEAARLAETMEKLPKAWTSESLLTAIFAPILWVVPRLITAGLTILAGAPKLGKSWLLLGMAWALSIGSKVLGCIGVVPVEVLYLALEDTPRRLQSRLEKMAATGSKLLHIVTEWPRGAQAVEYLDAWMLAHPATKVIFVDTLQRIRDIEDANDYNETYNEAVLLKAFADRYGVAVVCAHHTRKTAADDFVHAVVNSIGLTSAADTIITLTRPRGSADAVLSITGRDVEEAALGLRFTPDCGSWELLGDAAEIQKTRERQEVLEVLRKAKVPMRPKEIAETLKKTPGSVKYLLACIMNEEKSPITSPGYGLYQYTHTTNSLSLANTTNTPDSIDGRSVARGSSVRGKRRGGPGADPPDMFFDETEAIDHD